MSGWICEEAEAHAAGLEIAINAPGFYEQGHGQVAESLSGLEAARGEVERLYARWQDLSQEAG